MTMRIRLVSYWRDAFKFWSVKLGALGTFLVTFATLFPDAALQAWFALPDEFKQVIPPAWVQGLGMVFMLLSIVAKFVKQPKLEDQLVAKGTLEVLQTPPPSPLVEHDTGAPLRLLAAFGLGTLLVSVGYQIDAAVTITKQYESYLKRGSTTIFPSYKAATREAAELACSNEIDRRGALETVSVTYECSPPKLVAPVAYTTTIPSLAVPAGLTATAASTTSIQLAWQPTVGAAAYDIEWCAGVTCTNFARLSCYVGTNRINGSLTPDSPYRYRIRASRSSTCVATSGNFSSYSSIVSARTLIASTTPTGPVAALAWTYERNPANAPAEMFIIVYGNTLGPSGSPEFTRSVRADYSMRSFVVQNLPPGTWYFAVKTYSGGNESELSQVQTKTIT